MSEFWKFVLQFLSDDFLLTKIQQDARFFILIAVEGCFIDFKVFRFGVRVYDYGYFRYFWTTFTAVAEKKFLPAGQLLANT